MTDEQINAAIARECGWKSKEETNGSPWLWWRIGKDGRMESTINASNYCTDLNAMHEAEKLLAPKNWDRFSEKWWDYYHQLVDGDVCKTIHATARQRAEAFLRTLGKWEEGE
jgi:hypothetical protein